MAEKINIQVELESKLKQAQSDIGKLKEAKAFNGTSGEKSLNKINGLLQRLQEVDLKNLKGPELTKFLNDFSKLRSLLDTAARSLTAYSKAFENQQGKVNDANKLLNLRKSDRSEKLNAKKEALKKVNLSGHRYYNTETQKEVTNIDTIVKLFNKQLLEIRGEKGVKPISQDSYQKVIKSSGIQKYAEASNAYDAAKQSVTAQEAEVKAEVVKLNEIPIDKNTIHPTTTEVQKNSAQAEKTFTAVRNASDEIDEEEIKEVTNEVNNQIPVIQKQTSALGKAFKQFTLYNIALRAVKTALREAVQTVKELDKYLTEQAMVTGMSREQTYGLVKSYQDLALQCGATTKEIAQVSTEYMKQGKTIQESLVLTEAAVKAAKVARVSVGDSVNYLTTALNGFQLSAEDAMKVSDKFAAVAAASATDYDELAIALSKVASQANLAGMSIDYTTALLTKGLETTREAPETMGTALKTIIARMRELSDYGETLEGDTDINNVESQLAYVGIALRDTNGELRSTEDVLDELGKKWDTLNKNQQAALAKALAGTRQQSRLIALMDDYERVTELQEISQRSAGATAAQAEVYLEGIEASMNKIQVAWEKIIMTVSDSEVIISIFNWIGNALDGIGDFLSTDWGVFTGITLVAMYAASIVSHKIEELAQQKLINIENLKAKGIELEKLKEQKKANLETLISQNKEKLNEASILKTEKKQTAEINKQNKLKVLENKFSNKQISAAQYEIEKLKIEGEYKKEINDIDLEYQTTKQALEAEEQLIKSEIQAIDTSISANLLEQTQTGSTMLSIFGSFIPVLSTIVTLMNLWSTVQSIVNTKKAASIALTRKQGQEEGKAAGKGAAGMFANIVKAFSSAGIPGVIVGLAIATAAVAGVLALAGLVGMGISVAAKNIKKDSSVESAAEDVNKLSNEIYKLTEKANNLNSIADSFDTIDKKLIKTNKDLEEMNGLLDQVEDQLSDEIEEGQNIGYGVNVSEKDYYESFATQKGKREALSLIEKNNRDKANELRNQQIATIEALSEEEQKKFLDSNTTSAEIRKAQDNIYAYNNNELYEYLDKQEERKNITEAQSNAIESLTQNILEEMEIEEAWAYTQDKTGTKLKTLIQTIQNLKTEVKDLNGETIELRVAEVLTSDDYTLKEQVQAYTKTLEALEKLNDKAAVNAFKESFTQYDYFTTLNDTVLDFVDNVGLSINKINELYGSWEKLQKQGVKITQEDWEGNFKWFLTALAETNGNVLQATKTVFGSFLDGTDKTLNAFISAYGDVLSVGILNMGQQMDKIQNKINGFYEKALEWGEMNESERSEFLQDNADLFAGDEDLLRAFESGNYDKIEEALASSKNFQKQIEDQKEKIRLELLIEEARPEEEKNKAYIKELKRYQEYLNDAENLFKASLEIRLEQEQKQLDEYRSYLEDQQQALEDSLNKRKEAYEKYFDSISEEEQQEEYDEQANLLIGNINKLASSSNASSVQKTKELEQQLEELEKERLKELRERAQEKILENMDTEIEEISKKFDKLLESNQALLVALNGELKDPLNFFAELIGNKIEKGSTLTEIQDFIGGLQTTYGAALDKDIDWDAIKVHEENNQLFLTVNGKEIALDTNNEQNLYQAIMKALTEIGLR